MSVPSKGRLGLGGFSATESVIQLVESFSLSHLRFLPGFVTALSVAEGAVTLPGTS
jgi:hypothetical protein